MDTANLFVVTINNHPVLGPLFIPYFAHEVSSGIIKTDENATVKAVHEIQADSSVKKIISLAKNLTERNLMKAFSKERIIADFLHKLNTKTLNENIRPYIEKKHHEIIQLMRKTGTPLYLKDTGAELLYDHHAIHLSDNDVDVVVKCDATEHYFRYSLRFFQNEKPLQLLKIKPWLVLASEPALLLMGKELLVFSQIRAGRIFPFLEKAYVEVPASETRRYLEKIIVPLMREFPVNASGITIREEEPEKKALLNIAPSLSQMPGLELLFRYGKQQFTPNSEKSNIYPKLEEGNAPFVISVLKRDLSWEQSRIAFLKKKGFKQVSDSLFINDSIVTDFALVDWLNSDKEELSELFSYTAIEENITYYIGEIEIKQEIDDKPDWFEVRMVVKIGAFSFPFIRFKRNLQHGDRRFLLPDGQVALLPEEWFEKYNDLISFGEEKEDKMLVQKMHTGIIRDLGFSGEDGSLTDYTEKEKVPVPPKIKAVLRPYQQSGFSWLVHLANNRFGGCLADDMGLGKTVQTITLLQHIYDPGERTEKPHGSTARCNQDGQFSLFGSETDIEESGSREEVASSEDIKASMIVVPTSLLPNWKKEIRKFSSLRVYEYSGERRSRNACQAFNRYPIVLVTYGLLRRDIDLLEGYDFNYVVLDESQYIKNPESQTYKSVMRLKSKHRIALTGTPIENSLKDLWAQFNFINPGLLGTATFFRNRFIVPITKKGDTRATDKLLRLITPFFLRRTKKQVAPELPPLTEEVIYCEMSPEQKEVYTKEKNTLRNSLLEEWSRNKIMALNGILKLRQLANHPRLVHPDFIGHSGKMDQVVETYETLLSEGHKVLIFSSFVSHLDLLAKEFEDRGWEYAMLTGATLNREKEITRFSEKKSISAFLISLKAGGVGLNLTAADYVFVLDPWWNPASEMQAESRAHRIGQDKQVFVYRFISSGTIEEKIRALQERKSQLADTFISENDPLQSLTDQEWRELLRE